MIWDYFKQPLENIEAVIKLIVYLYSVAITLVSSAQSFAFCALMAKLEWPGVPNFSLSLRQNVTSRFLHWFLELTKSATGCSANQAQPPLRYICGSQSGQNSNKCTTQMNRNPTLLAFDIDEDCNSGSPGVSVRVRREFNGHNMHLQKPA